MSDQTEVKTDTAESRQGPLPAGPHRDFVDFLMEEAGRKQSSTLTQFKRVLGRELGESPRVFRHVMKYSTNHFERVLMFQVGTLAGTQPDFALHGNFGRTLRQVVAVLDNETAITRHFERMLSDDASPYVHLVHLIKMVKKAGVSVNYHQLMRDLMYWSSLNRSVQIQWAQSYFGRTENPQSPSSASQEA